MILRPSIDLDIVGPASLEKRFRACLRPGGRLVDRMGTERVLPSWFYRVPSWSVARNLQLTPHFGLWEFMDVDVREAESMRLYPRYVPCAAPLLAAYLQLFRSEVGKEVWIAANGGYRSPAHRFSSVASAHCWGTAANIYRVGDEWLDSPERVGKYVDIARRVLPGAWIRPYGVRPGMAFDHLHVDLGYLNVVPHAADTLDPADLPAEES